MAKSPIWCVAINAGSASHPDASMNLAAAILRLSKCPAELAAMGQNARAMIEAQFARTHAFQRWRAGLAQIKADVIPKPPTELPPSLASDR
jgi:hypothetical protein